MATIIVPPTPADPSMTELRAMIGSTTTAPAKEPEPKPETSENAAVVPSAEKTETAAETVEQKSKPEKSEEEPLPEGVQKRIAKEAEKAARIQSEIDQAVSARKAKEAELTRLKEAGQGSDPAQNTAQPATTSKRPEPGEKGHENETWEQYEARKDEWIRSDTIRQFREETAATEAQRSAQGRWDTAVEKHKKDGVDFPALMESARKLAPQGLQLAISALDNWDGVAVHLAKNPAELTQLAQAYAQNPTKAIATLGRIEAALISKETKPAATTEEKPLPEPLKKVGGTASASGEDFQTAVEKGSMSQLRAIVEKARGGKK